jgi:hypothetical protein
MNRRLMALPLEEQRELCPIGVIVTAQTKRRSPMNQIIYIVGLIVVVVAVLSFFGLR